MILASTLFLLDITSCEGKAITMSNKYLIVSFPLKGVYICPNTPGSKVPSHGTSSFGEKYAIDFVMIRDNDKLKKPYKSSVFKYLTSGLQLNDFYGWGQNIYSPVSGMVVETENNFEERNPVNILNDYRNTIKVTKDFIDNRSSLKTITGNYVLIKVDESTFALLAHLKKGSVKVRVGQMVKELEAIGELGHSGNSTMPHLHMQFMNSDNYKIAEGIPFVFKKYEEKQNNRWITVYNKIPKKEDVIKFCID